MQQIMESYFGLTDYVIFALVLAVSSAIGLYYRFTGGKQKTFKLNVSIMAVGVVCTFYSALGGIKAVLITDVFQSLLMFAAIFAVITRGVMDFSVAEIFKIAKEGERLEFFNISPDPRERHTLWSLAIGGCFTYCSLYGVNQAQVQRLLTIKDLHRAQASLWIQWPILTVLSLSTSFAGLVVYAQYQDCDPMKSGRIANSDQDQHQDCFMKTSCCLHNTCLRLHVRRTDGIADKTWESFREIDEWEDNGGVGGCDGDYDKDSSVGSHSHSFNGDLPSPQQLLPLYVVETMGMVPGLSGLFVSGIFSGSLSTVSSALNSLAAVTYQDYILPCIPHHSGFREKYATRISKILACVYGLICIMMSFLIPLVGTGVLQASLTIFGAVGGPLLALFTLGMLCRCANQKAS
ncbi:putative sodium-dependent multivitamin transporter [Portunus trituberculatus]|uniref:Putative sodium-dependent multivitamin transporter n=1 Tax=Portunus trituberculatus TaxID=210409 RepID=A0A5B7D7G3_PORTR|nr:putative sodium-dependent multivitamin transporter [Portunus trituberculatus]